MRLNHQSIGSFTGKLLRCLHIPGQGKINVKCCSLINFAFSINYSMVVFYNFFNNGKAYAGSGIYVFSM